MTLAASRQLLQRLPRLDLHQMQASRLRQGLALVAQRDGSCGSR